MELIYKITAIAVVFLIVAYIVASSLPDKDKENPKEDSFDETPIIGDFGIDPVDVEPTPVVEKPKRKYKKRNKKKPNE